MNLEQLKATIAELQLLVDEQETLLVSNDGVKLKDQDPCWICRFSPNSKTWESPLCKKISLAVVHSIKEQNLMCFSTEQSAIGFYNTQPRINEYVSASINVRIYANGTVKFSDGVNYFSKDEFEEIVKLYNSLNPCCGRCIEGLDQCVKNINQVS